MNIIGIDPGLSGGLAHIDISNGKLTYIDGIRMPVLQISTKAKAVNAVAILEWFNKQHFDAIVLERVASMPGQGVASTFAFGRAMGGVEALAQTMAHEHDCRVIYASPAVWKKAMGLSSNKQASMDMAAVTFGHNPLWQVKANDGIAEAALMAAWHYRQHAHSMLD